MMIKQFCSRHPRLAEIVRFLIIGGGATLLDMLAMSVVLYAWQPALYPHFYQVFYGGWEPSTAATVVGTGVGFIVGLIFNYVFSVLFVFQEKGKSRSVKGFLLFSILSLIGLGIHLLGMYLGYSCWHLNEWLVKIILTMVVLVYNYLTRKIFVFRPQSAKEGVSDEK